MMMNPIYSKVVFDLSLKKIFIETIKNIINLLGVKGPIRVAIVLLWPNFNSKLRRSQIWSTTIRPVCSHTKREK